MGLNELWFILIMVLFSGYFFLEGFDFGVGMLVPFLGKSDQERRLMINTIGPVWDTNEVWLLTAGGAIFAAFPGWYATMFSGFYLALFVILAALIVRGVAFEFRSKMEGKAWKKAWDIGIFIGSILPPLLLAVAIANLIKGVPIDANKEFVGNFFDLLSIPTLLAGLTAVSVFIYHGAVYLSLKLDGKMLDKSLKVAKTFGGVSILLAVVTFLIILSDTLKKPFAFGLAVVAAISLVASYLFVLKKNSKAAMILNGSLVIFGVASVFAGLFPRVMVSSINNDFSLTIYNVSSTPYTLKVMTIVTLTLLPIVLGYIIWTYWVFRKKIQPNELEY